jgi:RNA polymerase sigma-70 factor (ECF subfamily)
MAEKVKKLKKEYINNLAEASKTNSEKFGELYDIFIEEIYNFFFYRTNKNRAIAQDLTSETFEKVVNNIVKFNSSKAGFRTWLYTIAQNNLTDYYRKNKSNDEISLENNVNNSENSKKSDKKIIDQISSSNKDTDENVIKDRNMRILNKALLYLPVKDQTVLTLKYVQQLTYKEIATMLGDNPNAIGVRISRALKKLAKILEDKDLKDKLDF